MHPFFLVVNALILLFFALIWNTKDFANAAIKVVLIGLFLLNMTALLEISGYIVHR